MQLNQQTPILGTHRETKDKLGAAAKIAETLAANVPQQSSELLARSKRKTAELLTDARFTTGLGRPIGSEP